MMDQAKLAAVAYAQVSGADGLSTLCNSGLSTSRISTGYYALTLPTGAGNTQTLAQTPASDLIVVTPTGQSPMVFNVDNTDAIMKKVTFVTASNFAADTDFSVVIFRTLAS